MDKKVFNLKISLFLLLAVLVSITKTAFAITIDELIGDKQTISVSNAVSPLNVLSLPVSQVDPTRPSAVGGVRKIQMQESSTIGSSTLDVDFNILDHRQGGDSKAISTIIWDGDATLSSINHTGLGGIDFTQDGSTALRLSVFTFDYPNTNPVIIRFVVYSSATNFSTHSITLNNAINSSTILDFPYSSFTTVGGAGANFTNVGAIVLEIDGFLHNAIDVQIDYIGTNSPCEFTPNSNGMVVDECGVCNGDNTSCADCLGVPNGSAIPGASCSTGQNGICDAGTYSGSCSCERDQDPSSEICDGLDNNCDGNVDESFPLKGQECGVGSGVCEFKGTYICDLNTGGLKCDDADLLQDLADQCENSKGCDDVPNSGLDYDVCGICGGNGTSCLDCKGEINGPAKLDRCNVCLGDGTSCLECEEYDQSETLTALDGGAKEQERNINGILRTLKKFDKSVGAKKFAQRISARAHELQISNWILSWKLPIIVSQCENTSFCITTSNQSILDEYRRQSNELRKLGVRANKRAAKVGGKTNRRLIRLGKKNEGLHKNNMMLADTVPVLQYSCS